MKPAFYISTIAFLWLASVLTAPAALVLTFTDATGTFSEGTYTLSSLQDGTPTESGGAIVGRTTPTGSLSGVDNTVSISFFYETFSGSTLAGNDLTLAGVGASNMASNSSGIASADGDINAAGRGIFFDFDLASFAANTNLRVTAVTATSTGGSGHVLQLVVDGSSVTNMSGLSGSGLSIDITDGNRLAFRNAGTGGTADRFRLTSLTFEAAVIPEPSTGLLSGLGLLALILRRRRS